MLISFPYPTTHDWTKNELMMAVSTVMINWMMVFQVFRSFKNFIIVKSKFSLRVDFKEERNCQESEEISFNFWQFLSSHERLRTLHDRFVRVAAASG